jgi:hypothetical protein
LLQFYGNTGGNIKQENSWRSTAPPPRETPVSPRRRPNS